MSHSLKKLRGAAYFTRLKEVASSATGAEIERLAKAIQVNRGKLTIIHLGTIALSFDLSMKATIEILQYRKFAPHGVYEKLFLEGGDLKVGTVFTEVRKRMSDFGMTDATELLEFYKTPVSDFPNTKESLMITLDEYSLEELVSARKLIVEYLLPEWARFIALLAIFEVEERR